MCLYIGFQRRLTPISWRNLIRGRYRTDRSIAQHRTDTKQLAAQFCFSVYLWRNAFPQQHLVSRHNNDAAATTTLSPYLYTYTELHYTGVESMRGACKLRGESGESRAGKYNSILIEPALVVCQQNYIYPAGELL